MQVPLCLWLAVATTAGYAIWFFQPAFTLIFGADCIKTTFSFTRAAIKTVLGYLIVIFSRGMNNGFGRANADTCATKLTLIRIDLMHFFSLQQ